MRIPTIAKKWAVDKSTLFKNLITSTKLIIYGVNCYHIYHNILNVISRYNVGKIKIIMRYQTAILDLQIWKCSHYTKEYCTTLYGLIYELLIPCVHVKVLCRLFMRSVYLHSNAKWLHKTHKLWQTLHLWFLGAGNIDACHVKESTAHY